MRIKGKVSSGLGEGKSYVLKYLEALENQLGFTCYPGTLNLELSKPIKLGDHAKIIVEIPEKGFQPVDCYLVRVQNSYDGAIVIPRATRHGKEIVELVAPVNLRERLHLQDGDEIECELV